MEMPKMPKMFTGDSLAGFLKGLAVGAVATMIIGFNWGGWTLGSTAQKQADTAVKTAMVPICADQFLALGAEVQAEYKSVVESWNRGQVLRNYIKNVGGIPLDYSLGNDCVASIDKRLAATAAKS